MSALAAALAASLTIAQPGNNRDAQAPLPGQILGGRALVVRLKAPVAPVVAIAPDEGAYLQAIASWRPERRFPVLLDDGTPSAAHDIGRFVRAFEPETIVRLAPVEGAEVSDQQIQAAADAAWTVPLNSTAPQRIAHYRDRYDHRPAGIVLSKPNDPARTAAAAIAAFRGLPLAWCEPTVARNLDANGLLDHDTATTISENAQRAATGTGLSWRDLGDDLDAVALCLNVPVKAHAESDGNDWYALTDRVGRLGDAKDSPRWAFAGQITGDAATAAFRAMSGLFLDTGPAWLFDGYASTQPWVNWDMTRTAEVFGLAKIPVLLDDEPQQGLVHWRRRAESPLDVSLVMVNSSGNPDMFNLSPGIGNPGEAPILGHPAAIHFVHSWSATQPENDETVAGRFRARGAYAYIGSVQEPYLQAFAPSPGFAARLLSGFAWGAAPRQDDGERWRIAVLGDPMLAFGPEPAPRVPAPELRGSTELSDLVRAAAGNANLHAVARNLVMSARDDDAARLGRSLLDARDGKLDAKLAELIIPSLFRASDRSGVLAMAAYLSPGACAEAIDTVWHAANPFITSAALDAAQYSTLERLVRGGQEMEDAERLARAMARGTLGKPAGLSLLLRVQGTLTGNDFQSAETVIDRYRGN
ncbi:MAG: hypothetical protein AAGB51_05465 [Planctomycetota bacterium]